MSRRSWTELFFLDEATALAAGHRPCFYCRRADARAFRAAWAAGNGVAPPLARVMDAALHGERLQRSEEHTSELQSLMRLPYAVFCLKKKKPVTPSHNST